MQMNKLCYNSSHMHVKSLSIEGGGVGGGRGGGGGGEDWCQLPPLDLRFHLWPSPLSTLSILKTDWLEPSIFNSLTHSF